MARVVRVSAPVARSISGSMTTARGWPAAAGGSSARASTAVVREIDRGVEVLRLARRRGRGGDGGRGRPVRRWRRRRGAAGQAERPQSGAGQPAGIRRHAGARGLRRGAPATAQPGQPRRRNWISASATVSPICDALRDQAAAQAGPNGCAVKLPARANIASAGAGSVRLRGAGVASVAGAAGPLRLRRSRHGGGLGRRAGQGQRGGHRAVGRRQRRRRTRPRWHPRPAQPGRTGARRTRGGAMAASARAGRGWPPPASPGAAPIPASGGTAAEGTAAEGRGVGGRLATPNPSSSPSVAAPPSATARRRRSPAGAPGSRAAAAGRPAPRSPAPGRPPRPRPRRPGGLSRRLARQRRGRIGGRLVGAGDRQVALEDRREAPGGERRRRSSAGPSAGPPAASTTPWRGCSRISGIVAPPRRRPAKASQPCGRAAGTGGEVEQW